MRDAGNIFHYDFKTKQTTKVTQLENEFAKSFTISPDGLWIIYERSKTHEDDSTADLWMVKIDGSGSRLLVRNGMRPSWGKL
jgi:Tol biopolymer transport system component